MRQSRYTSVAFALVLASCFAPSGSFPNSVATTDAKGVTTWWGCMKLRSGDAREVGSYEDRALLLMPGGQCERAPALSDIGGRLFLTWRESKPDTNEEFGTIRLVVPADCPQQVSDASLKEMVGLLEEYLAARDGPARYRSDAELALRGLKELDGATVRFVSNKWEDLGRDYFSGGLWGPKGRPGGYPICVPAK